MLNGEELEFSPKTKNIGELKKKIEKLTGTPTSEQAIFNGETELENRTSNLTNLGMLSMIVSVPPPPEFLRLDNYTLTDTKKSIKRLVMKVLLEHKEEPLTAHQIKVIIITYDIGTDYRTSWRVRNQFQGQDFALNHDDEVVEHYHTVSGKRDGTGGKYIIDDTIIRILFEFMEKGYVTKFESVPSLLDSRDETYVLNRDHPYVATLV